jgi:hypothetical protein
MTPEGKIKREVNKLLTFTAMSYPLWVFKPVQFGYGTRALDYLLCINGHFASIEAKAPDEDLTAHQKITAKNMLEAGGSVFIISKPETLGALIAWLDRLCRQ